MPPKVKLGAIGSLGQTTIASTFVMYALPLTKGLRITYDCLSLKTNILAEKYVGKKDSRIVYVKI